MTGLQSPIQNKVFTVPLSKLIWKTPPSLLISNKPLQCETKGAHPANNLMLSCSAKNYTSCYDRRLISWREVSQRAAQLSNGKLSPLLKSLFTSANNSGKTNNTVVMKKVFLLKKSPTRKSNVYFAYLISHWLVGQETCHLVLCLCEWQGKVIS